MNGTRLGQAKASAGSPHADASEIRRGADSLSPINIISDHQAKILHPYLHPTGRVTVVGQGSDADYLSVTSYACDNPTGHDLAILTPIFTPQQYDSYGLPIEGSTVPYFGHTDGQTLDVSPGNTVTLGVIGKKGRKLAFMNKLVPGKGVKMTPYGLFDYKFPPTDSKFFDCPPQGPDALGTLYPQPGQKDHVVNRPLIDIYARDGLTFDTDDSDGFVPMKVKIGAGLSFGEPDPLDDDRRPLQVDGGGGSGAAIWPGPGIAIDPPSAPTIASVTVVASAGLVDDGEHKWALSALTSDAESTLNTPVSATNTPGNEQDTIVVNAVAVPPHNLTGLNLYRTKVGGTDFFLVTTFTRADLIAGISYTDNTADAGLGAIFPGSPPALISVDLATDVHGRNISGLVENAGDDTNGLSLDPYGPYTLVAGPGIAILPPVPPNAPIVVVGASGGSIDLGSHSWAVSYTLTDGVTIIETNPSTRTSLTIANPNKQVTVTADAPPAGNIGGFTARSTKLYRTAVGGTTLLLATESMGTGALSYTDSVADSGLGAAAPALKQSKVQVDLARDGAGANISNLVENAGTDSNGLKASAGTSGVAAQVHGSGSYGVGTFQLFDDFDVDTTGSIWDAATRLTIPETGLYYVYANSMWESVGATGSDPIFWELNVTIGKNGPAGGPAASNVAFGQMEGSWPIGDLGYGFSNRFQCMAIGIASLVAGDYIRLYVTHTDNAPTPISPVSDILGLFKIG